ncbi:porin family protein [Epilithonimonas pallida]|uniref:Outer membrane insertion C-terminal signal n=1 Tax=Epilithonimonas pallida TaxID=373671 RepID=A0ABY1R219_9FLAO|nr:porin family protein [Epilithonimonas pallida]SMP92822.1 outer membrane insertion C-terminal signal [Epilithonimonas pallida]
MKKLFLGLGLVAGTFAFAQTSPSFGLKAGLNVSSISDDGYEDSKAKAGFYGGVFMNAPLSEQFSIQPEVLYSQYGAKVTQSYTTEALGTTRKYESSQSRNLDYITVPVMFQFHATPNFYLEAGPEFGFLVSAKDKGDLTTTTTTGGTTSTSTTSGTTDIKDGISSFNMGAGLGLGFNFTPNFGINARYVAGFTDINKKNNGEDGNTTLEQSGKNRNNTFQVGLSYKF